MKYWIQQREVSGIEGSLYSYVLGEHSDSH